MHVFRLRVIHIFILQKWDHSVTDSQHTSELSTKSFRRAVLLMQFRIYSFYKLAINGPRNKADSEGFGANSTETHSVRIHALISDSAAALKHMLVIQRSSH